MRDVRGRDLYGELRVVCDGAHDYRARRPSRNGQPRALTKTGWHGRAFPTAAQVAIADDTFFRDVARAEYRGAFLQALARAVVAKDIDVEAWRDAARPELSDEGLEELPLALPGVGPYAVAHALLLFGRRSRLVLNSWTRPTYARLVGKKIASDKAIECRFKRYGEAGLAFWLFLWKKRHLGEELYNDRFGS